MSAKLPSSVLLKIAVVLTLLACSLSGFDLAFTTYSLTLKNTYNFTQTQVEVAASFSAIGMGMCFMEVILNSWLGYKFLFAFTWVVFPGASFFLSRAPSYSDFFHENPLPIYIALFLMSTASGFSCMATTSIMVSALSPKHTGKFIGAFTAATSLGKLSYGLLIQFFFSQHLAGFFLTIALVSLVLYTGAYLVLHVLKSELSKSANHSYGRLEENQVTDNPPTEPENESLAKMMSSLYFHFVFWSAIITYACMLSLMNNITSIGESVGVSDLMVLVYIMSIIGLLARLLVGYIIDRFQSIPVALVAINITNLIFCLSHFVGIFYLTKSTMYVFSVFLGASLSGGYTILVPLVTLKFGRKHFRLLTCAFFGIITIFMFAIQVVAGIVYDSKAAHSYQKEVLCLGKDCYYETFISSFVLTCVAIICNAVILVKEMNTK